MHGLSTLDSVYKDKGESYLNKILNGRVLITIDVKGSYIGTKRTGDDLVFYKKDGVITKIDRILTKLYEPYIAKLESQKSNIIECLGDGDTLCMEFVGSDMFMTHIIDSVGNTRFWPDELESTSASTSIPMIPVIFNGTLDDAQKKCITEFAYTNSAELLSKFKTKSFTDVMLSTLNSEYEGNIDSLVMHFSDGEPIAVKILNPVMYSLTTSAPKAQKPTDYMYLILMDIISFIEEYTAKQLSDMAKSSGVDPQEYYVNLVNAVFKEFISKHGYSYIDVYIDKPQFLKKDEFSLNTEAISDPEILALISMCPNYAEIYKIMLNSLRKKRKNSNGIFNKDIVMLFNSTVDKIRDAISEPVVTEGKFMSFMEYFGRSEEEPVNEATYSSTGNLMKVNILVDWFQPINNSHIESAKIMKSKNGLPCVFVVLYDSVKSSRFPIRHKTIKKCADLIMSHNPGLIVDCIFVSTSSIMSIFNILSPKYMPVICGVCKQMSKDYAMQMERIRKKKIFYNIDKNMRVMDMPTGINNRDMLNAILAGDYQRFKEFAPSEINSMFFNIQQDIRSANI
jgi:hypothetical protein